MEWLLGTVSLALLVYVVVAVYCRWNDDEDFWDEF